MNSQPRSRCRFPAFVLCFLLPGAATPCRASEAPQDYERLRQARYSTAVAVPAGGLSLEWKGAVWTLESGQVRLAEPASDGTVTGLVFEGRGRFQMAIPDPVEQAQWNRAAGLGGQQAVDEPFTVLVLRTSGDLITESFAAQSFETPSAPSYDRDKTALDRHENWLVRRSADVDARVVCGLLMPGDEYLRVGMKTDSFDWLTYEYDALRQEEIQLTRFVPQFLFSESWVSLDRPEDRDDRGRPSRRRNRLIDLKHVEVAIDITRAGKEARSGLSEIYPRRVKFIAEMVFEPRAGGATALPLVLHSWSEVTAVETPEGQPLEFLRDHIGSRSGGLDNRIYDRSLVVVLDRPLIQGEERRLVVEYERELINYAPGRSWYPGEADSFADVHTAKLSITSRKKDDVRAMGARLEERQDEGGLVTVWNIERPAKMVTFSFAERFHEEKLEQAGVPDVIAFAASSGMKAKNKTYNVAADVLNSLSYFQNVFDHPLPVEQIYATSIVAGHGQAFEGFLHLSELSFEAEEVKGPTQLFRAHEVAHQWWGHEVAWSGYRDQWLSEAFAQYSAMMFLENTMEKGKEYYDEIVEAYTGQMLGVVRPSRFARFPLEANDRQRERIGPISIGYRASTAQSRSGYVAQSYYKGALVLHMLRTMLRNMTKSDDTFILMLRDFLKSHRGGEASTQDFIDALSRRVPVQGGWDWFFEQWVHDTVIPTYIWSYEVSAKPDAQGKFALRLDVEQTGVPEGFRMPVPVMVEFGKGAGGQVMAMIDQPRKTITLPLPRKPKKVTFNPGGAVLARMKKR